MVVLLIVLLVLGFAVNTVIYFIQGISPIRGLIIYLGFRKQYADRLKKYGITFKPISLDLWEKTPFDDYSTEFLVIDKVKREQLEVTIILDKWGNTVGKGSNEEFEEVINTLENEER
jgi:hypothetical protein